MPPSSRMNPNPLSISSLAIVPVGIPESPPSDKPAQGGLEKCASLGSTPSESQYRWGYFVVVGVGACAGGPAGVAAAASLAFSLVGGGYVDQKCRPHFGQTQN